MRGGRWRLPTELRTRETSDEHLPGYAELYTELAPANPDPDTLSDVLQQRAAELAPEYAALHAIAASALGNLRKMMIFEVEP